MDKLTGDQNQTWQTGEGIEVRMTGISYLCEPSSSAWKNREDVRKWLSWIGMHFLSLDQLLDAAYLLCLGVGDTPRRLLYAQFLTLLSSIVLGSVFPHVSHTIRVEQTYSRTILTPH